MAYFYIPTNLNSISDVYVSWDYLKLLINYSDQIGMMFVSMTGWEGFTGKQRELQYENYLRITQECGPILSIVMTPNLPWEKTDWYHNPDEAFSRLRLAVDFASTLPNIQTKPFVSFHLNTLFTADQWNELGQTTLEKYERAQEIFLKFVIPSLIQAVNYADKKDVRLFVETTPIPEFGDRKEAELYTLSNPYPLHSRRGIPELRNAGFGIALDLCHTFTLFKIMNFFPSYKETLFDHYRGFFSQDFAQLSGKTLFDEVRALQKGDIIHLNDSQGYFCYNKGIFHDEGVTLGEGEISYLPSIVNEIFSKKDLHVVFEINEEDYVKRPNLKKSIEYLISHVD